LYNVDPYLSGVNVTRSLALCFVYRCLSFCTFSFGHYVVCSSSIYGFWLPLWYLQTLLSMLCTNQLKYITNYMNFVFLFQGLSDRVFWIRL